MKPILLLGASGQVGQALQQSLGTLGQVISVERPNLDLTCLDDIRQWIRKAQPRVIVNASAYTAVEKAESEPDLAHAVNAIAPTVMGKEALKLNALLAHISTDFVFDGQHHTP